MKFHTLSRRAAAVGAASALVAGALVAATATTAQAAPVSNTYTCTGISGPFPVALTSDAPGIEQFPSIGAGFDVPGGLLTVTNTFTVPSGLITTAQGLGITDLASPDFAGSIGSTVIPVEGVSGALAEAVANPDGLTHSFVANGTNTAFEVPAAGSYDVLSPESFHINAMNGAGTTVLEIPCVLADGEIAGAYHNLVVTKNASTTTAKARDSRIKKGDVAKIAVKVAAPNETPSGKVVLKRGTKTLAKGTLNDKGKVLLKAKKGLKVGKNKLVASYKGDGYTTRSKDKLVVKVTR